jgi:hypothetical protein
MSKQLKRMRDTGERIYPNPPTPEDLQKLYEFPTPKVRPKSEDPTDRKILIDPEFLWPRLEDMFTKNSKEDMNLQQARKLLNKNAPPGEFAAYIDPQEASWLKGMGASGKKTKSGLRSFASPNAYDAPGTISGGEVNTAPDPPGTDPRFRTRSPNEGRMLPEVPNITPGGGGGISSIPNPLAGGSETRTPAGPGSVTDPNDPYGINKKIAGGASDLIDKEYVAPTLTPEERIAATSAETIQAREGVQDMQGTGQDAYASAAGVGKSVSGYTPEQVKEQSFLGGKGVDQYMSPHTQNVIGGMQENAMRTMQKQRGALQAQHQMAGAGIGSRGALENAAMSAEVQRGLGQQVAGALEGSYAQAAGMKGQDMDRAQQAARYNQQAGLAGQDVNLRGAGMEIAGTSAGRDAAAADINMLSGVGADVEGRDQNVIDETMGDFYEKRDWGENKLASAANIYGTMPTGSTTTTTGAPEHRKKDKFGRIISGAASGWLATGGNPYGAAVGGGMAAMDW